MSNIKHDTSPLERIQGELLPLTMQLAEATLFIGNLQASGQIRDTRQGDDPDQVELDAACAVAAIGQAQSLVIEEIRTELCQHMSGIE